MAQIETWLPCDLDKMVQVVPLKGNMFSADNQANLIGAVVTKAGQAVNITGGVTGYVIRQDGATVILTGSATANKAYIVLPTSCYVVPGRIDIVIKNGTTTLAACTGTVARSTTDAIVDPGHVIPSIEELLAKIADCEAATTAANTAAGNANTKAALADEKATLADQKATAANTAAGAANTAAGAANAAATKIDDMTAAASGLAAGASPTVQVSEVSGHKHLAFGIPKGDTGEVPDIKVGTVTTLQPDQPASVTRRSGSPDEEPIFDFALPKGETGSVENVYGTTIEMSSSDSTKVATAIGGKTDKVQNATSGNLAGLDANGNLTDSGYEASDFADAGDTEQSISGLADALAIVTDGDTHIAISSGQFVYVRNHSTLAEGLYKASSNIAADGALSSSNLTADSNGGLNALNEQMANNTYSQFAVNVNRCEIISGGYYIIGKTLFVNMTIKSLYTATNNPGVLQIANSIKPKVQSALQCVEHEKQSLYESTTLTNKIASADGNFMCINSVTSGKYYCISGTWVIN